MIGTALALVLAGTGVLIPLLPLAALLGLAVVLATPMRGPVLALTVLALLVDNPGERPMDGRWESPLLAPGRLLYLNLNSLTGIGPLRFSLLEALIVLLVAVVVLRKLLDDPIDDPRRLGLLPNPMRIAFAVFATTIVALEFWGLARGGDFRNSLWQARQLFWLPVLGVLFGNAFKEMRARAALLRGLVAVAWVRCLAGIWFYFAVARPSGVRPEYSMTHSDSVLIVVAAIIAIAALVERPSIHHLALNLVTQPVFALGLIVNDRRLAFVMLGGGMVALILMGPPSLKRLLRRSLIVVIPLALLYVGIGWNSNAGAFRPVGVLRSLTTQTDTSSKTRDIENYNLIKTLEVNPLVGSGFGHEYRELVEAYRVDQVFEQYRYIAHNSVLWLLSLAGWIGFTLLWSVFPVGVAIALSAHRNSRGVVDRVTTLATVVAILSFVLQAWGDMGLQSWMATIVTTALMGASGALFTSSSHQDCLP
jgi:hypothetical protein